MASNLTAVWQTFGLSTTEELTHVSDVAARLGADSAIAFKDIMDGMRNSGAAASQLGLGYEQLAAIITTVGDVSQKSASVIDNSFKTMFARMVDLKAGGEDEEGITYGLIGEKLSAAGFDAIDQETGKLKDLGVIITDLGDNWETLTKKQQMNLAQVVGGKRQYTDFLTLMNNWNGQYAKFLKTASSSDLIGETDRQFSTFAESLQAQQQDAANAWQQTMSKMISPDLLKSFAKMSETVANMVSGMVTGFGGLKGIMIVLGTIMTSTFMPKIKELMGTVVDSGARATNTFLKLFKVVEGGKL
jgi:TP901 family phage tail tape measure protein